MSKDNDISATEKLLEMIRGEDVADQEDIIGLELDARTLSGLSLESSSTSDDVAFSPDISSKNIPNTATSPASDTVVSNENPQDTNLKSEINTSRNTDDKSTISLKQKEGKLVNYFKRTKQTIDKTLNSVGNKFSSFRKTASTKIGIDLQNDSLSIAVLNSSPITIRKENFFSIPIPPLEGETPRYEDPEFIQFFKKQVEKVCPNYSKAEIWCSFNNTNAEILTIIIPKVPKKEIANAVFWFTKKETEYDMSKYVLDFSIRKEITEGSLKKIIITVYLLPIKQLNGLKDLFHKMGLNLTGVSLPPSAFENLARNGFLPNSQETSVHLSLSRDQALIDMYYQGAMLFTRTIKTGISSIVESIFDKAAEQDLIIDDQSAINLLFSETKSSFYHSGKNDTQELNELVELITPEDLPVTTRLSRQLSRTFDYCSTHFKIPRASCLFTSGPFILKKPILDQLDSDLNINCNIVDLCANDKSNLALPADIPDEIDPIPAFGLAMSDKESTQNFLYTFADKKEFIKETRINQGIALITIIIATLCCAFFLLQNQTVKGKRKIVTQLTAKLEAQYAQDPRSIDATFSQVASKKIAAISELNNKTALRFQVMSAISLLLENIPEEIKLTDLRLAPSLSARKTKVSKGKNKAASTTSNSIRLKGVISSWPDKQNFILLDFQKRLYNMAMIDEAVIDQEESVISENGDQLHFTVNLRTNRGIF